MTTALRTLRTLTSWRVRIQHRDALTRAHTEGVLAGRASLLEEYRAHLRYEARRQRTPGMAVDLTSTDVDELVRLARGGAPGPSSSSPWREIWKTINRLPPEVYRPGAIVRSPHTRDR